MIELSLIELSLILFFLMVFGIPPGMTLLLLPILALFGVAWLFV